MNAPVWAGKAIREEPRYLIAMLDDRLDLHVQKRRGKMRLNYS